MFISVRYWDDVPKGTVFNFDNVNSFSCIVEEKATFLGDELEIFKIIYNDEDGSHEVHRVIDFDVM